MKKLTQILSVLTISLSLLTTSIISTNAAPSTIPGTDTSYSMIARVTECTLNPIDLLYHTIVVNENEDAFIILSDSDLTDKWLNCSVDDSKTPAIITDDIIYDFELLEN